MNNKKTDNYKNYKYVYTGYKDYCKEHNIKTTPTKKEHINHDHRLTFDFDNPNEHYHDYSFDFNNPNEHYHDYSFDLPLEQKKTTQTKKTVSTTKTVTTAKPTITTTSTRPTTYTQNKTISRSPQQTQTKNNNNTNNNSGCGCLIMIFFFFMFFVSIISSFEDLFDYDSDYDEDYDYTYSDNYDDYDDYDEYDDYDDYNNNSYETNTYQNVIDAYIRAVRNKDTIYIDDYFYTEYGKNFFYQEIDAFKTKYPVYSSFYSQKLSEKKLDQQKISSIEAAINSKYEYNIINIVEAYEVNLYFLINDEQIYKTITIVKANNYWHLLKY